MQGCKLSDVSGHPGVSAFWPCSDREVFIVPCDAPIDKGDGGQGLTPAPADLPPRTGYRLVRTPIDDSARLNVHVIWPRSGPSGAAVIDAVDPELVPSSLGVKAGHD